MKRNVTVVALFGVTIAFLPEPVSGAISVEEQVKRLAQRYDQVEAQLDRSVRYASRNDQGDSEQAWFNGSGDLIKVRVESHKGTERQLTEYFALDFDSDYDGTFLVVRKETPSPDGGMQVEESRKYFGEVKDGNGVLIRELRKNAHFKPGETTDTVHTPNVAVDLKKKANQPTEDELRAMLNAPTNIADELKKGTPEVDPFANVKGERDKFRIIRGTASLDGRYAIALGSKEQNVDWEAAKDSDFADENAYRIEDDKARNYVVDLTQQKIIGETGAAWSGTRRRYNHPECVVWWSPDSSYFVQLLANKWASDDCVAGKIGNGPKLVGSVNLMKTLTPKVYGFLKRHVDPEGYPLFFYNVQLSKDGAVEMKASENISSGERKGDTEFVVGVRLRLHETPKGLSVEGLNMRRLSNE